jgi:YD repeat-containing protein
LHVLTEHFYYDALNRIEHSTLAGVTNLTLAFDASGNILSKTAPTTSSESIGAYTPHPTKRYAVASTGNGWTFSYDANGNMLTNRGATISWFSYNKPNTITNGSLSTTFAYTPGRQYWKQTAAYANGPETSIYIGGLREKVSGATFTD